MRGNLGEECHSALFPLERRARLHVRGDKTVIRICSRRSSKKGKSGERPKKKVNEVEMGEKKKTRKQAILQGLS